MTRLLGDTALIMTINCKRVLFWDFHVYSCCGQGRHMLIGKLQKLEEKSKQEVNGS